MDIFKKFMGGHYKAVVSSDVMKILVENKDNDSLTFKVTSAQIFGCMWPTIQGRM